MAAFSSAFCFTLKGTITVCLCLDTSGSMQKNNAIGQLIEGASMFYKSIKEDEQARNSCEIAIVTFDSEVKVIEEFSSVETKQIPHLEANGGTAMAHGVDKALDLLNERKEQYKANGVDYFQPWLVIITDGKPGDLEDLPVVQEKTKKLMEEKKLAIFPIVVGSDDNPEKYRSVIEVLNGFCIKPKALHLKDSNFKDLFEWLGKSVSVVSNSRTDEKIK